MKAGVSHSVMIDLFGGFFLIMAWIVDGDV